MIYLNNELVEQIKFPGGEMHVNISNPKYGIDEVTRILYLKLRTYKFH